MQPTSKPVIPPLTPREQSQWGEVVETKDGSFTIRNPTIDECYHCFQGAKFEARCLYVEASGILTHFERPTAQSENQRTVTVLDVGLGLGYNAIATVEAWLDAENPPDLTIVSLEIVGSLVQALASGIAPWQSNWTPAQLGASQCLKNICENRWLGSMRHPKSGALFTWEVYVGDAANAPVPDSVKYQFVWQDPFSPGKGPALWDEAWFRRLSKECAADCRLMTFSVARLLKDALAASGWQWKKIKGPAPGKRKWTTATWPGDGMPLQH